MSDIDKNGIIIIASVLITILIVVCIKFCDFNYCNKIRINKTINYQEI